MTSADVILGMLLKRSFSGYEIKRYFENLFTYFCDTSFGTIYPTLNKLENAGCIAKETIEQDNRPNKHVYSITERGREQFLQFLRSPIEDDKLRSDFMLRLYFGEFVDVETAIGWMRAGLAKEKASLGRLESDYEQWQSSMSPTQLICITFGLELHRAKIRVFEEGLQQLQAIQREKK